MKHFNSSKKVELKCSRFQMNGTCVDRCPQDTFATAELVCEECDPTCTSCNGPSALDCLSCASGLRRLVDSGRCTDICPDGYFESGNECHPCAMQCENCTLSNGTSCEACGNGLILHDGQCRATCPKGMYEEKDYTCISCHSSCETCLNGNPSHCVTCPAGSFLINNQCLPDCPAGFTPHTILAECRPCPAGCADCSYVENDDDNDANGVKRVELVMVCRECEQGWRLDSTMACETDATNVCEEDEFSTGSQCRNCHRSCARCYGPKEDQCLTCPKDQAWHEGKCVSQQEALFSGYFVLSHLTMTFAKEIGGQEMKLEKCPTNCIECTSLERCTVCAEGLFLEEGKCLAVCSDGFYSDRGLCIPCPEGCSSCSGPMPDDCLGCFDGYNRLGSSCFPQCPSGFYNSTTGHCLRCYGTCKECKGSGPFNCTSCSSKAFLDDNGMCMPCSPGTYYDKRKGQCVQCHSTCTSCTGPGRSNCRPKKSKAWSHFSPGKRTVEDEEYEEYEAEGSSSVWSLANVAVVAAGFSVFVVLGISLLVYKTKARQPTKTTNDVSRRRPSVQYLPLLTNDNVHQDASVSDSEEESTLDGTLSVRT